MSLNQLKEEVLEANLALVEKKLVISTWGNVSGYDPETGFIVIKASGIPYNSMKIEHMVVVDLDGKVVNTNYRPSSDTKTHILLYREFAKFGIRGIVHTHSKFATSWAQSGLNIPCLGTTHADYFVGDIPNTRLLTASEIADDYEGNTGKVILESMSGKDCLKMSSVLVHSHGPFVWGKTPAFAVLHSEVLEYISEMAFNNFILGRDRLPIIQNELAEKHYSRKFGVDAYYGQ
jgi:L-ribulose-5-phosphate 4-epimerase